MAIAREAEPVGSLKEVREAGLLREDLLGGRFHRRPVDGGVVVDLDVAPDVQRDEVDAAPRCLVERGRSRQFRRRRPVDADENWRISGIRHQGVLVVNDRHRAVGVADEAGTD